MRFTTFITAFAATGFLYCLGGLAAHITSNVLIPRLCAAAPICAAQQRQINDRPAVMLNDPFYIK